MQDDRTEVTARHPMTHACRLAMPSADVSNIQARDAATQHNSPRLIHNQVASTAQSSVCMTRCPGGHLSQTLEKKGGNSIWHAAGALPPEMCGKAQTVITNGTARACFKGIPRRQHSTAQLSRQYAREKTPSPHERQHPEKELAPIASGRVLLYRNDTITPHMTCNTLEMLPVMLLCDSRVNDKNGPVGPHNTAHTCPALLQDTLSTRHASTPVVPQHLALSRTFCIRPCARYAALDSQNSHTW